MFNSSLGETLSIPRFDMGFNLVNKTMDGNGGSLNLRSNNVIIQSSSTLFVLCLIMFW